MDTEHRKINERKRIEMMKTATVDNNGWWASDDVGGRFDPPKKIFTTTVFLFSVFLELPTMFD